MLHILIDINKMILNSDAQIYKINFTQLSELKLMFTIHTIKYNIFTKNENSFRMKKFNQKSNTSPDSFETSHFYNLACFSWVYT